MLLAVKPLPPGVVRGRQADWTSLTAVCPGVPHKILTVFLQSYYGGRYRGRSKAYTVAKWHTGGRGLARRPLNSYSPAGFPFNGRGLWESVGQRGNAVEQGRSPNACHYVRLCWLLSSRGRDHLRTLTTAPCTTAVETGRLLSPMA